MLTEYEAEHMARERAREAFWCGLAAGFLSAALWAWILYYWST